MTDSTVSPRDRLFSKLEELAAIFKPDLDPAVAELYVGILQDYPGDVIDQAVRLTILEWRKPGFLPVPGFIVERIARVVQDRHREQAELQSRATIDQVGQKPEDWSSRLDEIWADIDRRRAEQNARDLAVNDPSDEHVELFMRQRPGQFLKLGIGSFTDWSRRKTARDRQRRGERLPSMREQYEARFKQIFAARNEAPRLSRTDDYQDLVRGSLTATSSFREPGEDDA